jgi:hypothetical protein
MPLFEGPSAAPARGAAAASLPAPFQALFPALLLTFLLTLPLAGCSPALDWREVRPADTGAQLLLPCKPASHARELTLAGQKVRMVLHACRAADTTWAVAWAELADPARTGPALAELKAAAAANIGASLLEPLAGRTAGETPNPNAGRFAVSGRLPDGQPVQGRVVLAARGPAVMQVTALGPRPEAAALDTFVDSLRLR